MCAWREHSHRGDHESEDGAVACDNGGLRGVHIDMEDERTYIRRKIERYERLRRDFDDERLRGELDHMIEEARERLQEIERRS